MVEHWLLLVTVIPIFAFLLVEGIKKKLKLPLFIDLLIVFGLLVAGLAIFRDPDQDYYPHMQEILLGMGLGHFGLLRVISIYWRDKGSRLGLLASLLVATAFFFIFSKSVTEPLVFQSFTPGSSLLGICCTVLLIGVLVLLVYQDQRKRKA